MDIVARIFTALIKKPTTHKVFVLFRFQIFKIRILYCQMLVTVSEFVIIKMRCLTKGPKFRDCFCNNVG